MSAPGPVVVLGDVMVDVVVRPSGPIAHGTDTASRIVMRPGGAAGNVAAWLGELGCPVVLAGCVGDDPAGALARAAALAGGVVPELVVDPQAPTGTCVVLVDATGERTMLPDAGANDHLSPVDLPPDAGHLHVCGYALIRAGSRPAARAALDAAIGAGVPTSVDPSSAGPLAALGAPAFRDLVQGVDTLLVTRDEGEVLCGTRDPGGIAASLLRDHARVVVKRGPDGASCFARGGRRVDVPAAPPPGPVVDTTGAGDAFCAAWLDARRRDMSPSDALAGACALAARVTTREGARPDEPI